jgi:hypothetical protein
LKKISSTLTFGNGVQKRRMVGSGRSLFPGATSEAEHLPPFSGSFFDVPERQKSQQIYFSDFMKNIYIYG